MISVVEPKKAFIKVCVGRETLWGNNNNNSNNDVIIIRTSMRSVYISGIILSILYLPLFIQG